MTLNELYTWEISKYTSSLNLLIWKEKDLFWFLQNKSYLTQRVAEGVNFRGALGDPLKPSLWWGQIYYKKLTL